MGARWRRCSPTSRRTSCTSPRRSSSARRALAAAARLGLPSVAVYQTDMPSSIRQHGPGAVRRGAARAAWRWIRKMHGLADLTLAPSTATLADLRAHGVPRTALWATRRGRRPVPPGLARRRRHPGAARSLAPGGEVLVGYVGRIAAEKELDRLVAVRRSPGCGWCSSATGPTRDRRAGPRRGRRRRRLPRPPRRRRPRPGVCRARRLRPHRDAGDVRPDPAGGRGQRAAGRRPRQGGPLDLVDHSRTGLLFDPDDPGALTEAVAHLVGDRVKRRGDGRSRKVQVGAAVVRADRPARRPLRDGPAGPADRIARPATATPRHTRR